MNSLTPVFWQNTLPLMVTIVVTVFGATVAGWASNKNLASRMDDLRDSLNHRVDDLKDNMDHRFDEVDRRLDRIEQKLDSHEARLTALEERTSPLRR